MVSRTNPNASLQEKFWLIEDLAIAGLARMEVRASRVRTYPQLVNGVEVLRRLRLSGDVVAVVQVPNSWGIDRALEVHDRFDKTTIFVSISERDNRRM